MIRRIYFVKVFWNQINDIFLISINLISLYHYYYFLTEKFLYTSSHDILWEFHCKIFLAPCKHFSDPVSAKVTLDIEVLMSEVSSQRCVGILPISVTCVTIVSDAVTVLYYIVFWYIVLYLYFIILYFIALYCIVLCNVIYLVSFDLACLITMVGWLYCYRYSIGITYNIRYNRTGRINVMDVNIILYYFILYHIVLYSIVF